MKGKNAKTLVYTAMLAAIVCVVTLFRFPLLGSKVHFANAMCLLAGFLFGPLYGGVAAGLGSGLYDALLGGYDIVQVLITFVSKFLMAWLCAKIAYRTQSRTRAVIGAVSGALCYVALYMLKTFVYQSFVYGYPMDAVGVTMLAKLPASLINAGFAIVVAPILYFLLKPALTRAHILEKTE